MFQEMNPMAKSTAWLEISILILVAFILGFVISWLYWKWKRENELNKELEEAFAEINRLQQALDAKPAATEKDCCGECEDLKAQLTNCKDLLAEKEQKVASLEGVFEKIFDYIDRGVTMSDKKGDFIIFNKKMAELSGYTKDEANSATFFLEQIYPDPEDRKFTVEDIERLEEEHEDHYVDTSITTKSGEKLALHVLSCTVKWKDHDYFLSAYKEM